VADVSSLASSGYGCPFVEGYHRLAVAASTAHGNLQVELSSFVGRNAELLEIRRLVAVTHTVTLTGPGGIGKSRLAMHAGDGLGRHFPDGVWLVELGELDSPERLQQALANTLKVYEQPGGTIDDAVVGHLRERRLLLLLDECEGTLDACCELVSAIVSRCPDVRFICTSRQRLGVPGEAVVLLTPLEVPAPTNQLSVSALADADALRLLVDRARAVRHDFELNDENREAVVDICRRLDGLPLAIELAAGRLGSISPADLLARLDDRFRLLKAEHAWLSGRHTALRATVEWSHELLSEEERILWRRLSVFAGSFGVEAAEVVCSGEGLERDRILDLIARLVDRSILTMAQRGGGGRGRYRLLETLRLYGAERLREAGEDSELQRRHAAWHAELISGDDVPWWGTADQAEIVDLLDIEWANVEAALEFCIRSAIDAETGLRIVSELWPYWVVRGRYLAGRRHVEAFLATTQTLTPTRARALFSLGHLAQTTGDNDAALAAFEEAHHVAVETGEERELAYALLGLGLVRLRVGELDRAIELLVASRETMLQVADPTARAYALYTLATALAVAGQLTDARAVANEGLDCSEQGGDTIVRSLLSTLLGVAEWQLGDERAAEVRLDEAVRIQDRIGHRWALALSLCGLAGVASSERRLERSASLLGAIASLWQELGIESVPYWQRQLDATEESVREGLGEARYRASWELGFALGDRDRVALALDDEIPPPDRAASDTPEYEFELTARELEVARLVADGLSNPAIAATLFVSRATVKTHVSHILRKLTLDSRVQLASWVAAHDPAATRPDSG
jgi:predicted ATPase/DNA-binding CsgD family transcriptional regulator